MRTSFLLVLLTVLLGCNKNPEPASKARPSLRTESPQRTEQEEAPAYAPSEESDSTAYRSLYAALAHPETTTEISLFPFEQNSEGIQNNQALPEELWSLTNLRELRIQCFEAMTHFPDALGKLEKLEKLIVDNGNGCSMSAPLPETIGNLHNLRFLKLYGAMNPDTRLPGSLSDLKNLEFLDLGRNGLREVPSQISTLPALKGLYLRFNRISSIPDFVGTLTSLEELDLEYNRLNTVPGFLGNMPNLKVLNLTGNGKLSLPQSFENLRGTRIVLGQAGLSLKDQETLRRRFPNVAFDFEAGEFDTKHPNEIRTSP